MALTRRLKNMLPYLNLPGLRNAFGLLSSEERQQWIRSAGFAPLDQISPDKTYPWYTFRSIEYLEHIIRPDMKVLEYGSGYSTLWWARRVAEVTSVERSKVWCDGLEKAIKKNNFKNVRLVHFDKFTQEINDSLCESKKPDEVPSVVNQYVLAANPSPAQYDVVIVDDVYRNVTSALALEFIKPGGVLILDDSERKWYQPTIEALDRQRWSFASFYGATPYHFVEKQTTIWFKPTAL